MSAWIISVFVSLMPSSRDRRGSHSAGSALFSLKVPIRGSSIYKINSAGPILRIRSQKGLMKFCFNTAFFHLFQRKSRELRKFFLKLPCFSYNLSTLTKSNAKLKNTGTKNFVLDSLNFADPKIPICGSRTFKNTSIIPFR
jgi:hypothetical protein